MNKNQELYKKFGKSRPRQRKHEWLSMDTIQERSQGGEQKCLHLSGEYKGTKAMGERSPSVSRYGKKLRRRRILLMRNQVE